MSAKKIAELKQGAYKMEWQDYNVFPTIQTSNHQVSIEVAACLKAYAQVELCATETRAWFGLANT